MTLVGKKGAHSQKIVRMTGITTYLLEGVDTNQSIGPKSSQRSPVPGCHTFPSMVEVHRLPLCVTVSPVL